MVNEDFIKPEDRQALEMDTSKYATMDKSQLEYEIYANLMEQENSSTRK